MKVWPHKVVWLRTRVMCYVLPQLCVPCVCQQFSQAITQTLASLDYRIHLKWNILSRNVKLKNYMSKVKNKKLTSESPVYCLDSAVQQTAVSHLNPLNLHFYSNPALSDERGWTLELRPQVYSESLIIHSKKVCDDRQYKILNIGFYNKNNFYAFWHKADWHEKL